MNSKDGTKVSRRRFLQAAVVTTTGATTVAATPAPTDTERRRLEALVVWYARERERFADMLPLARGDLEVAYEVRWNGETVGEERASLMGGVRMIHVQQVGDAPNKWTRSLRAWLGEDGRILSFTVDSKDALGRSHWEKEGRGPLKVISSGKSRDLEMKKGILDLPFFFAKISLANLVEDLAVGATRDVVVVELVLRGTENLLSIPTKVTRHADAKSKWGTVRVYTLDMKRPEGAVKTELRVDPVGIPIRMETRLELGSVVYERVK